MIDLIKAPIEARVVIDTSAKETVADGCTDTISDSLFPELAGLSLQYNVLSREGTISSTLPYAVSGVRLGEGIDGLFLSISEEVPEDLRPLAVASFAIGQTGQSHRTLTAIIDGLGSSDEGQRFTDFIVESSLQTLEHYRNADPNEFSKNTGQTLIHMQRSLLLEGAEVRRANFSISGKERELLRKGAFELRRLGIEVPIGERLKLRRNPFLDGDEVTEISLVQDKARGDKLHVCKGCHVGIEPGSWRVSVTVRPRNGFNHHHYHPDCA